MPKSNRTPSPHETLINTAAALIESFLNSGGLEDLDEDRAERVLVVVDPSDRIGDRMLCALGWKAKPFFDFVRDRIKAGNPAASVIMQLSEAGLLTVEQVEFGPAVGVARLSTFSDEIRTYLSRAFALRGTNQVVALTVTAGTFGAQCLNIFPRGQAEA